MRFARIDAEKMAAGEGWFAKHGALVVLFGRWIPGVRSVVSLPAGLLRMSRWKYLLFTTIGSTVWNAALVGAGWALGTQWESVADVIGPLSKPLFAAAVLAAAAALTWRGLRRRREARATG
jgi:membrane protein DedA with SNARE-associated domain